MPRIKKVVEEEEEEEEEEELIDDEPPTIEPYTILSLEKTATADEIKKAYRKAALKHHPDKASPSEKSTAHTKFQEIAFAYAILSDPIRRKRYDTTGSTSESISADDFNWSSFYSEQFKDVITADAITAFSKSYKGSDEEKDDVLAAYEQFRGKWNKIYEVVMLSNPLEDEDRYREIIDKAIEEGEVEGYDAYTRETSKAREARMKAARKEGKEAMAYAEELGVSEKLFGGGKNGKGGKDSGESGLAALIRGRQADRGGFFDHLEAKYGGAKKSHGKGKGKKRASDEDEEEDGGMPSEEAFLATRAKMDAKVKKAKDSDGDGRKTKRVKR